MMRCKRVTWSRPGLVMMSVLVIVLGSWSTANAGRTDWPVVRGEMARLYRQAYDYNYRNSNRNVFRSSRHFHPTRNVFRSSRHYQGRLASSFDGYPLRSTIHFSTGNTLGGLQLGRSVSVVHPRRHPTGPTGFSDQGFIFNRRAYPHDLYQNSSLGSLVSDSRYRGSRGLDPYANKVVTYTRNIPAPPEPREIEMVEISLPQHEATHTVVLRTITLEDGSIRVVITSEPIVAGVDEAWELLELGDIEAATSIFVRNSLDVKRGAEAMLGYALARARSGDESAAVTIMERAMLIDEGIVERVRLTDSMRQMLQELLEKLEGSQSSGGDDAAKEELESGSEGERD